MAARDGKSGRADGTGSDDDLAGRLDRLSRELDAGRRDRAAAEEPQRSGGGADVARGVRLASEFVAGILVGAALGWGLDRLAGTSPWGLMGFLLLGFGAGVVNVVRASSEITKRGAPGNGRQD